MTPSHRLVIDCDRFLVLVAAIAASACAEPRRSETATPTAAPTVTAEPEPEGDELATEPEVEEVQVATAGADPACNNDRGTVDCSGIRVRPGPACEGTEGSCELLKSGYGFKLRVAAAIAACWTRLGSSVCSIEARKRCIREALGEGCPDPKYTADCQALVDACKRAKKRVDYSVDECVQTLSSLDDKNREWAKSAMAPSAEGCQLMFPVY